MSLAFHSHFIRSAQNWEKYSCGMWINSKSGWLRIFWEREKSEAVKQDAENECQCYKQNKTKQKSIFLCDNGHYVAMQ